MSTNSRSLCLLALDGGGVRGLSELYILNEMMLRIQKQESLPHPPKPCELFDLICGTSTGGLIALMLGRLRMSVDQVIAEYCKVAREVFGNPKNRVSEGRFKATTFESVIKNTVKEYGIPRSEHAGADPNLKLLDEQPSDVCQVFVCSRNARAMDVVRLFRSYRSYTVDEYEGMAIWEAARATSAAPTFFKRLSMGPKDAQEEFLDGGMGSNNPTKILIEEAVRKFRSEDPVTCIISIGTGKTRITEIKSPGWFQKTIPLDLINALKAITTDCETIATELEKRFSSQPGIYFRFNVEHGLEEVRMDEWKELGNIKAKTVAYLAGHAVSKAMDQAAIALFTKNPRVVISDLDLALQPSAPSIGSKAKSNTICIVPFERRVSRFVGRTDILDNIHAEFIKAEKAHLRSTTVVLRAMGGQGKTQVALAYCDRVRDEGYDYILWVDAESQISFEQSFATFNRVLPQPRRTEEAVLLEVTAEGKSILDLVCERLVGKKYLMVIDNLDTPSEHRNIQTYLTLSGTSHIIVTSRHMDTELLGLPITLPAFSVQEGRDLLACRAGREGFDDDTRDQAQIVFELGGLPLGLDQAALLIREKNLTYSQFLKEFREVRTTFLDEDLPEFWEYDKLTPGDAEGPELRKKIGVQTTWTMSLRYLSSQSRGESKCHLLTLSAYLSSSTISQATFSPFLKRVQAVLVALDTTASAGPLEDSFVMSSGSKLEADIVGRAIEWTRPLLGEDHALSGTFSNYIRDAYKLGLVASTRYDEIRGTIFSLHPLVSRWLVQQDDNKCVIEALFVVQYLLDQLDESTAPTSFLSEVDRHVIACIGLDKQLPVAYRLGSGDLHNVGTHLCYHALDEELLQPEGIIEILKVALCHNERIARDSDMAVDSGILHALGVAFWRAHQPNEAKKFLQLALARELGKSLESVMQLILMLIKVSVHSGDEAQSISIPQSLLDYLRANSSTVQSSDLCKSPGDSVLDPYEGHNVAEYSSIMFKTRGCAENLPDVFWLRFFHDVSNAYKPRYDLGKTAVLKFLSELEHRFPHGNIGPITIAAQYNLGILCFASKQWQEAQDMFQSVLQAVHEDKTTNLTIAIELSCSSFMTAIDNLENIAEGTLSDLVREKVSSLWTRRTLSRVQIASVQKSLTSIDSLNLDMVRNPGHVCWLMSEAVRRSLLPESRSTASIHRVIVEHRYKLLANDVNVEDLRQAEAVLQRCVDKVGHSEDTSSAYLTAYIIAFMLNEWRICLRLTHEELRRIEDNGEEPGIITIHSLGRAYLRLGEHDRYEKHKERYPQGDWCLVEAEERDR